MPDSIRHIQEAICEDFSFLEDWSDRYAHLIDLGMALRSLPEAERQDRHLVPGCQSRLWLVSAYDAATDTLRFQADSDALIVKGLVALFLRCYDRRSPSEILEAPPRFIEQTGLAGHLSPGRANGLRFLWERLFKTALFYQNAGRPDLPDAGGAPASTHEPDHS